MIARWATKTPVVSSTRRRIVVLLAGYLNRNQKRPRTIDPHDRAAQYVEERGQSRDLGRTPAMRRARVMMTSIIARSTNESPARKRAQKRRPG